MTDERIIDVTDHGMWRGHRTWTVHMDGPTGLAQVSVRDEKTEAKAIAQALETYRNRRVFTLAEREAMDRNNATLRRFAR